jgi:hypothetical protein
MNQNISYRVHKNMPLPTIPKQMNAVHIRLYYLSKIYLNNILPSSGKLGYKWATFLEGRYINVH